MEQKNPVDLKNVAKRFTEIYYPQWLSRVDRIWDMFENIDLQVHFSKSPKTQRQQGNAFGITGEIEPKFRECISGIAILAFTYQDIKGKDTISEDELRKKISIVPAGLNLTSTLQNKLENVLAEILPSMVDGGVEQLKNKETSKTKNKNSNGDSEIECFTVYVSSSSGFGAKRSLVAKDDLHSHYMLNKKEYDIIVYQNSVEIKTAGNNELESIELYSNILNLLILFLKYKDESLSFLELYHCAWKGGAEYKATATDSDVIMDDLKTGVSSLRKHLKIVKNFIIPNAKKKTNVYVCKGGFKFCLILKRSMDRTYTLEVD